MAPLQTRPKFSGPPRQLPPGWICRIAQQAGISVSDGGGKQPIRCPLHEDSHASAFLDGDCNVFYCSVCTPAGGWSARRFAEAVGQSWPAGGAGAARHVQPTRKPAAPFTATHAQVAWSAALARTRDDDAVESDRCVYDYLCKRGLADAGEEAAFGVLADGMPLTTALQPWLRSGHRLVAPLYDATGSVSNIQGRAICPAPKKTLFPTGSRAKGMLFASRAGLDVLKGCWTGPRHIVLGEGLTDFLALCITSLAPVLSAPGTGMVAQGIGGWIAGFDVLLALDNDSAGSNAVQPAATAAYAHGARRVRQVRWPGHAKDACAVVEAREVGGLMEFLDRELEGTSHG